MLAKERRLAKQKDFEKVFKQGRAYYTKILGVKILFNGQKYNRFGIIISSKVSKKAVERNKLKRQIREVLREFNKSLRPGFDMAIIVLPALLNQDYNSIKIELEKIFFKLRLL